jgi:hypothetical protein
MIGHYERFEDFDTAGEQPLPRPPAEVKTVLWDLGPILNSVVPTRPDSTAPPSAWQDYELDLSRHVAAVLRWRREKVEFDQKHGGSVKLELDAASAREALERGAGRYVSPLPPGLKRGA